MSLTRASSRLRGVRVGGRRPPPPFCSPMPRLAFFIDLFTAHLKKCSSHVGSLLPYEMRLRRRSNRISSPCGGPYPRDPMKEEPRARSPCWTRGNPPVALTSAVQRRSHLQWPFSHHYTSLCAPAPKSDAVELPCPRPRSWCINLDAGRRTDHPVAEVMIASPTAFPPSCWLLHRQSRSRGTGHHGAQAEGYHGARAGGDYEVRAGWR